MSYDRRDPDDPDGPREPTASDIDAAFAQIVAGWDAEGRSRWPGVDSAPTEEFPAARDEPATGPVGTPPALRPAPADASRDDAAAVVPPSADVTPLDDDDDYDPDDHYVPPEPPPLPRPQPATLGAVALFLVGIILLTVPWLIGFSSQYGMPLGLLAITGSIAWLVARLREGPPPDSGWDDGAQV